MSLALDTQLDLLRTNLHFIRMNIHFPIYFEVVVVPVLKFRNVPTEFLNFI
jgi:hypothetical protein